MVAPAANKNKFSAGSTSIVVGYLPEGAMGSVPIPDSLHGAPIPHEMQTEKEGKVRVKGRTCKVITPDGKKSEYASPYLWHFEERFVSSVSELHDLIDECGRPDRVILMGELVDPWRSNPSGKYRRQGAASGGTIAKQPSRLLTLDFDDAEIPGFNPLDPLPGIDAFVMTKLGDAFASCGYVCQLTTGQRPEVGSLARIRLWFYMKQPMSFDGRSQFLKQLILIDGGLKIDPSSCKIVQLNYTSPPIVVPDLTYETLYDPTAFQLPDILPQRLFLKDGPPLDVEEPVVETETFTASGDREKMDLYLAGDELDALLSDGDAIHDKIRTCTFNLARNQGNSLTADEVGTMILQRLMELSEPGQPYAHRRSRIANRSGGFNQELLQEVRNAYMGALKRNSLRSVGLHLEEAKGVALPVAEKLLTERFCEAVADNESRIHVIKATCGLGKTRTALQAIKETDGVCYLFVPDHKKAAEVVIDARAMGIKTAHIKGRTRDDDDGVPLCKKSEALFIHPGSKQHRYVESGMTCKGVKIEQVIDPVWGSVTNEYHPVECPHFNECGYNRQFHIEAKLYVFTHANLMHPMREHLPTPALSVIDEDPCGTLRKEEAFDPIDLFDWSDMQTAPCIEAVAKAIIKGHDLMVAFRAYVEDYAAYLGRDEGEVAKELVQRIRRKARAYMRSRMGGITPDMDPQQTVARVGKRPVSAPWVSIVEVLDRGLQDGAMSKREVRFERNTRTRTEKVTVRRMIAPKATLGKKVILLDATPHEVGLRHIFGGYKMHEFEVQENCFEVQVLKPTNSDSSMRQAIAQRETPFNDLMAFTRMIGKQDGAGVVTKKEFAEAMPLGAGGYDMPVMTFGALRGQNMLESRSVLLSLGRLLVPSEGAEGDAAAIYPDIDLQDGGRDYYLGSAKYMVRNGSGKVREVVKDGAERKHPDPRVDFEKSHRLLSEYKQAKGRLRSVRAGEKKLILNMSDIATGEPVDMLVDELTDLIGIERMASIMERQMGCLPLRPKYLFETFPEYFATLKAAQEFVADVRKWWAAGDRRFFLMVHEQPNDLTAATTWRQGYRKGSPKAEGSILRIRFWEEVRRDPDLGHEKPTRVRDFMLPTPGVAHMYADTY